MVSIGKEIRQILGKKKVTLYRISKDLGTAYESLYRSLRENTNPRWNTIKTVLGYLDYEIVLRPKRKEVKPEKPKPSQSRRRKGD
jgi:DNA-binding phage protein